jgi:IS5 family transposase
MRVTVLSANGGTSVPSPGSGKFLRIHIGFDADSGLVHTVVATAASVNDKAHAHALVHSEKNSVLDDAGYQGVDKRAETQGIDVDWHVAIRPGKRKVLDKRTPIEAIVDQLEQVKASIRAKDINTRSGRSSASSGM